LQYYKQESIKKNRIQMKALFEYLRLKVIQLGNFLKDKLRWPVWYFAGMTLLLFVLSVEILDTWAAWLYLMIGFMVWGYKRTN
jgi:hypothetical protein